MVLSAASAPPGAFHGLSLAANGSVAVQGSSPPLCLSTAPSRAGLELALARWCFDTPSLIVSNCEVGVLWIRLM